MLLLESNFILKTSLNVKNSLTAFFVIIISLGYSQEETVAPKYSNSFLDIGIGADALSL